MRTAFGLAIAVIAATTLAAQKPVPPVDEAALRALLPELSGWTREAPKGERVAAPIPYSQAEAFYTSGRAELLVKIVDSGFRAELMEPWQVFMADGFARESREGYEKAVEVRGHPGFETWKGATGSGELNFIVSRRFLVSVLGERLDEPRALHDAASRIDLARLAALR